MRLILMIMAVTSFLFLPVQAQEAGSVFEALSRLNGIQSRENPGYKTAGDIIGRRVLDSKNKVVGEVENVVLAPNGSISALGVNFNRLGLTDMVYLDYRALRIQSLNNAYALGFEDDQIEALYPQLLSSIETAAGEDGDFSLRTLKGTRVKTEDGRTIGQIEDVFFSARGRRAEALSVNLRHGNMRAENIAIPFNMGRLKNRGSSPYIKISNAEAEALVQFSQSR